MKCDLCPNEARHCCRSVDDGKLKETMVCTICAGRLWTEQRSIHHTISFIPLMKYQNETASRDLSAG